MVFTDNMCAVGVSFVQYLTHIPQPSLTTEECNSAEHYAGLVPASSLCTHHTVLASTRSVQGGAGSPLLCLSESTGSWEVVGLLSHMQGTHYTRQRPLVFSSVLEARTWVASTVG